MKASLLSKIEALADRHQEVEALLGDAEVIRDQNRFRDLSMEFAHLNEVVIQYRALATASRDPGRCEADA